MKIIGAASRSQLEQICPKTKVVILSEHNESKDPLFVQRALHLESEIWGYNCAVPGVSVVPLGEASTNTPKRWLVLSTGKDNGAPGTFVIVGDPGVNTENGSLFEAPGPGVTAVI